MDPMKKLRKARFRLAQDAPFFGNLALHLNLIETERIPTTAVDGKNNLLFNAEFVKDNKLEHCVGLVAHEVMHLALDVFGRRKGRDPVTWNKAHDYAINPLIIESGLSLPDGVLMDERFRDDNGHWMNAEKIYKIIREEEQEGGGGGGEGDQDGDGEGESKEGFGESGGCCDHTSVKDETQSQQKARERHWKGKMIQAANTAEQMGKLPAGIKRMVDELVHPQLPWRTILKSFISNAVLRKDYSYRKPGRRSVATGYYTPSMPPDTGIPAFCFDTSGSVGQEFLKVCISECAQALEEVRTTARFLSIDTEVHSDLETDDIWEVAKKAIIGGGGTNFVQVFELLEENPPCALVFFSDMWAEFPTDTPNYPVLWVTPERHGDIPWGKHLIVKHNERNDY